MASGTVLAVGDAAVTATDLSLPTQSLHSSGEERETKQVQTVDYRLCSVLGRVIWQRREALGWRLGF